MVAQECLFIVITASLDDAGRKAAIAFGVALAAVSSGATVFVFLSLEAAVLAAPSGGTDLRPRGFSEPLADYVTHFTDLGGQLEVCSSCLEEYCRDLPRDASGRVALRSGTTIHGLGIVAERVALMPTLTF
jgi:predicted peroxiredoxin